MPGSALDAPSAPAAAQLHDLLGGHCPHPEPGHCGADPLGVDVDHHHLGSLTTTAMILSTKVERP